MEKIGDILRDTSDGKITDEQYKRLREFFVDKSCEEKKQIVSSMGRVDLVNAFINNFHDMLECYAIMSKNTFRSFALEIYEILIKLKDEDLILKYLEYIHYDYMVKELLYFVHDDDKKMKYIFENELDWNNCILLIACSLDSDMKKVKCCELIRDVHKKIALIITIKDEKIRVSKAMELVPHFRMQIFKTVESQSLLRELYFRNCENKFVSKLLCLIHDDELKIIELKKYSINEQIDIINSLDSEVNVKKIIWNDEYDGYCDLLVGKLQDEEFILKYFKKSRDIKFKSKIIKAVHSQDIKRKLILLIDDIEYQKVLLDNMNQDKDAVLKDVIKPNILYDIDSRITIGVELEACCECPEIYLNLKNILCDWDVKIDRTVTEGIEISSPILRFCEKDLIQLKYICDMLNKNHFYINEKCGGHIHLGFDYFETVDEFKTFLLLYRNVEDIIYLISNRCFSEVRIGVDSYAKRISSILKQVALINVRWDKADDLLECVTIIKDYCDSRYYGLNVWNATTEKNTIEFRMPNGEIDFKEVVLNIRLFTKMFEVSKKIAQIKCRANLSVEEKQLLAIYDRIVSDERNNYETVKDLLELLFSENERGIYMDRYTSNRKIHKSKQKKLLS